MCVYSAIDYCCNAALTLFVVVDVVDVVDVVVDDDDETGTTSTNPQQ